MLFISFHMAPLLPLQWQGPWFKESRGQQEPPDFQLMMTSTQVDLSELQLTAEGKKKTAKGSKFH